MIGKLQLLNGIRRFDRICAGLPAVGKFRPLRGGFSAFESLERKHLEGEVLVRSQQPGPCPHGSMTERSGMRQNDHQPWPVFWAKSDDARLVGNTFDWRDENDRRCSEGVFQHHERHALRNDRLFAQILVPKPISIPGAWTSITSNWSNGKNYYHWMLDSLTRLKVRESLPEPTRILLPESTYGFVDETLEMLGLLNQTERHNGHCLQPERYYFCSPTAMTGVWNPLGYEWLRKKFRAYLQPAASGQPIFLTRRGGARVPENIAEIETIFTRFGFVIIDCGAISVKEQMRLASIAPAIAGLHGAAMTNLLWAHPGTPVLEIFNPAYLNACYEQIAFHNQLSYHHEIIDHVSGLSRISGWCSEFR